MNGHNFEWTCTKHFFKGLSHVSYRLIGPRYVSTPKHKAKYHSLMYRPIMNVNASQMNTI